MFFDFIRLLYGFHDTINFFSRIQWLSQFQLHITEPDIQDIQRSRLAHPSNINIVVCFCWYYVLRKWITGGSYAALVLLSCLVLSNYASTWPRKCRKRYYYSCASRSFPVFFFLLLSMNFLLMLLFRHSEWLLNWRYRPWLLNRLASKKLMTVIFSLDGLRLWQSNRADLYLHFFIKIEIFFLRPFNNF